MDDPYDLMRDLLTDRPVVFHPQLARALGGIHEALFFQQMAYWSGKGKDPDWIYKTRDDINEETCLSRYQQEQARKALIRLGVLEEKRAGVPSRVYYRVIWPALFALLAHAAGNSPRTRRETDRVDGEELTATRRETDRVDGGNVAVLTAGNSPTSKKTAKTKTKRTKDADLPVDDIDDRLRRYAETTADLRRTRRIDRLA